jgi:hypothetical protein
MIFVHLFDFIGCGWICGILGFDVPAGEFVELQDLNLQPGS